MIDDSLAQGWKLWTAQAAELQLLRADKSNRQVQGAGFFKMAQKDIDNIQEDIMKDMDEIAAFYREEIQRIMQEFDKHDIGTSVQLDKIEAERTTKTPNLQSPEREEPQQQKRCRGHQLVHVKPRTEALAGCQAHLQVYKRNRRSTTNHQIGKSNRS